MTPHAIPLDDATPRTSGGKAATLAVLRRGGITVPDGFVIPFQEYQRHHPHLDPHRLHHADGPTRRRPDGALLTAIESQLTALFGAADAGYVAVRSSAGDEDGLTASAAGQHDTILAVRGVNAVADAVTRCWASLHSTRAVAYRHTHTNHRTQDTTSSAHPVEPVMAVLIQRLIDPDTSGVLFTRTPRVIEAIPGLGEPLVAGQVTPDAWTLDDTGIIDRRRGTIPHQLRRTGDHLASNPLSSQPGPCLSDTDALALDRLGARISDVLGYDADIEWAITAGRIHILQARPITAPLTNQVTPVTASSQSVPGDTVTVYGVPASPGKATGTARTLHSLRDFHHFTRGDIIVCRSTDPAWTPLFTHAAGVITETGGLLSHAAIVAREVGIPAILAIPNATRRFPTGTHLTLDGQRGIVQSVRTNRT